MLRHRVLPLHGGGRSLRVFGASCCFDGAAVTPAFLFDDGEQQVMRGCVFTSSFQSKLNESTVQSRRIKPLNKSLFLETGSDDVAWNDFLSLNGAKQRDFLLFSF